MDTRLLIALVITAATACGGDQNNPVSEVGTQDGDVSASDAGHSDRATSDSDNRLDAGRTDDASSNDTRTSSDIGGGSDSGPPDGGATTDAGSSADASSPDASADAGVDMAPPSNDPFDPGSCSGTPWEAADALARLAGAEDEVLADATVMTRSRTCDDTGCGPWTAPEPTVISFLTWSGGVTTRYTQLQIDTKLVLWDDNGAPKLSVRHDTHINRYPDDHAEGITFGFPAQIIPYPYIRAWNVAPENQYDYRDLENYLGRDAQVFASPGCARFLSVLPGQGQDVTREYAALYRF